MKGPEDDLDAVRVLAAAAAASVAAAWKVVADTATVPALQRTAAWAVRCQEHAVHAVTWAATAHEYAGDPAGASRIARARSGARKEAAEAEAMLRAAEEAARGRRRGGPHGGPKRRPPGE